MKKIAFQKFVMKSLENILAPKMKDVYEVCGIDAMRCFSF